MAKTQKRIRRLAPMDAIKKDRISELPEELRHQILSYLPINEAAATGILSKSWKKLWLTLPWLRCHGLKSVKISNTFLHNLGLIFTFMRYPLEELEIMDAPALQDLYLSPGTVRVKVHLNWYHRNENNIDAFEYEKLVDFLGNFDYNTIRCILDHMEVHFTENLPSDVMSYYVVPPDIRRRHNTSPLLSGSKDFTLHYVAKSWKNDDKFKELIDGLLWLCPRPNTIIIKLLEQGGKLVDFKELKFDYWKEYDKFEKCDYCQPEPVECLRHCKEKCGYCEVFLRCWRHVSRVTIMNKLDEISPITSKHDMEALNFFNAATKSRRRIELVCK